VYLNGGAQADLVLDLPGGSYRADWINTRTGALYKSETFNHGGGRRALSSPAYQDDVALRLLAAPSR
jgi:hypothetical protein